MQVKKKRFKRMKIAMVNWYSKRMNYKFYQYQDIKEYFINITPYPIAVALPTTGNQEHNYGQTTL